MQITKEILKNNKLSEFVGFTVIYEQRLVIERLLRKGYAVHLSIDNFNKSNKIMGLLINKRNTLESLVILDEIGRSWIDDIEVEFL